MQNCEEHELNEEHYEMGFLIFVIGMEIIKLFVGIETKKS